MVEPFRRVLYELSKELSDKDLEDLVFICKVPASLKKDIKDGKDLFRYLEERGVICDERTEPLKDILMHLRPTRRDLLRVINEYERSNSDGITSNIVTDDASSFSLVSINHGRSASISVTADNRQATYCSVDCICIRCHGCSIMKPFCCCSGVATFLLFTLLITVVFWFAGTPRTISEYLNANRDRKDAGIIIVGILCFLIVAVIVPYILRNHWKDVWKWYRKKKYERLVRRHRHNRESNVPDTFETSTNPPNVELPLHVHANEKSVKFEDTQGQPTYDASTY